jgi:hypothetical protein
MSRARLGFCASVAVIAAAIADPLIEFASNAGWFGAGSFTDRSNLDVVPALLAGVVLLGIFLARKARALLTDRRLPGRARELVPIALALQICVLYVMETAEQFVTAGHALGPTVWLGGPVLVSLTVHAVVCAAVTAAILRLRRVLAETALRAIAFIASIVKRTGQNARPLAMRPVARVRAKARLPILCTIGERAPPAAA